MSGGLRSRRGYVFGVGGAAAPITSPTGPVVVSAIGATSSPAFRSCCPSSKCASAIGSTGGASPSGAGAGSTPYQSPLPIPLPHHHQPTLERPPPVLLQLGNHQPTIQVVQADLCRGRSRGGSTRLVRAPLFNLNLLIEALSHPPTTITSDSLHLWYNIKVE